MGSPKIISLADYSNFDGVYTGDIFVKTHFFQSYKYVKQDIYCKWGSVQVSTETATKETMPYLKEGETLTTWISNLYVNEQHRKEGLGTALFEEALKTCKENGHKIVFLTAATPKSEKFYKSYGFVYADKSDDREYPIMYKRL